MTDYCHNCGGGKLHALYTAPAFDRALDPDAGEFGVARCESCGLVNTLGVTTSEVNDSYSTEYYGSASGKFLGAIERILSLGTARQAGGITRRWRRDQPAESSLSVLDIGCGRGHLLLGFRSLGADVLGLERAQFPAGERSCDFIQTGSITDPVFRDRHFDIIVLWHVLEHLEHCEALLDRIAAALNDGGLLVIAVPNFSSLQQRLFGPYWFHLDLPRHLVHFETEWLRRQLVHRGFQVESTSHFDPLQNLYGFIQSTMNALAPQRQNAFYRLLKHGRALRPRALLPLLGWGTLSLLLLPCALLETLVGALLGRGATLRIEARLEQRQ